MNRRYVVRELKRPVSWARKRLQDRALILMYHGVDDVGVDPWSLFVRPDIFAGHLDVINEVAHPISLTELAAAHGRGEVPDRAVVVTFDDGYANNLHVAKPLLESKGIPATVFVITNPVQEQREFWWDELADILLRPGRLPPDLRVDLPFGAGEPLLTAEAAEYSEQQWRADHDHREGVGEPSDRISFYLRVWDQLMPIAHQPRIEALEQIATWAGVAHQPRATHRPVTTNELDELDRGDFVEVGAHTATHPLLQNQTAATQQAEISDSRRYLESVLGRSVDTFSYPFGGRDATTIDAVREAGFEFACAAFPETICERSDPYELPRFDVKAWSAEGFARRLERWFRYL